MHVEPLIPMWCSALVGAVAIYMAIRVYRTGKAPPNVRATCCALRMLMLLLLVVGLFNPYVWRSAPHDQEGQDVAILVDSSASMGVFEGSHTRMRRTADRLSAVYDGMQLPESSRAHLYTFSDLLVPADRIDGALRCNGGTRMYQALTSLLHVHAGSELAAVLIASDGVSPLDALEANSVITQYRTRGIPISVMQAASARYLSDIRIAGISVPARVNEDERATISVTLDSEGYAGTTVPLVILREEQEITRVGVELDGGVQQVAVSLPPKRAGEYLLTARVLAPASDASTRNNSRGFGYRVTEEKIRVLYMEGSPNMRWQALKDALETDDAFEVTALHCSPTSSPLNAYAIKQVFRHPGSTDLVYHVAHPAHGYPRTMKDLLKYDVVINSDIPKVCFSPAQMEATLRFVEEFGGGFVMIGGSSAFGKGGYNTSPIEKIIPVAMEVERDELWRPFRLAFPEGVFEHPLMAIGDNAADTKVIWTTRFPILAGQNRVDRTKPAATLLAANAFTRNRWGPLVVLACQETGRGRSLAFTSDTTPDWGTLFESQWGETDGGRNDRRYYTRFWQNAMRWLGAARIGVSVGRIMPDAIPLVWQQGSRQEFRAAVYDAHMNALAAGDLSLIFDGNDAQQRISVPHVPGSGVCAGWVTAPTPGSYRVTAILGEGSDDEYRQALGRVLVERADVEMQILRGDDDVLAALAEGTSGCVLDADAPGTFSEFLTTHLSARRVVPAPRPYYVWRTWYTFLIILTLLAAEWYIRRRAGLA